jgi:hypothetical protein
MQNPAANPASTAFQFFQVLAVSQGVSANDMTGLDTGFNVPSRRSRQSGMSPRCAGMSL